MNFLTHCTFKNKLCLHNHPPLSEPSHLSASLRSEGLSTKDAAGVCRCSFCQSPWQQYSHGGWVSQSTLYLNNQSAYMSCFSVTCPEATVSLWCWMLTSKLVKADGTGYSFFFFYPFKIYVFFCLGTAERGCLFSIWLEGNCVLASENYSVRK